MENKRLRCSSVMECLSNILSSENKQTGQEVCAVVERLPSEALDSTPAPKQTATKPHEVHLFSDVRPGLTDRAGFGLLWIREDLGNDLI